VSDEYGDTCAAREHRDHVFAARHDADVGWYRGHLEASLSRLARFASRLDAAIVDVGCGTTTLASAQPSALRSRCGNPGSSITSLSTADVSSSSMPSSSTPTRPHD
jgi:hypothetical protein